MKKLTFSLVATKFVTLCIVRHQPTHSNVSQAANQYVFARKRILFIFRQRLCFAACRYSFTLRWNNHVQIKVRSDTSLKLIFKICLKRKTSLMQACSGSQHRVIMPFRLPKALSRLKKCPLSQQSAFINFAPYMMKTENRSKNIEKTSPQSYKTQINILPYTILG